MSFFLRMPLCPLRLHVQIRRHAMLRTVQMFVVTSRRPAKRLFYKRCSYALFAVECQQRAVLYHTLPAPLRSITQSRWIAVRRVYSATR